MYGRKEHLHALGRISDITRDLYAAAAKIEHLSLDLGDDDLIATTRARAYLETATTRIASALGQCDLAVQSLPMPVARKAAS
jgi:hypothetical protein